MLWSLGILSKSIGLFVYSVSGASHEETINLPKWFSGSRRVTSARHRSLIRSVTAIVESVHISRTQPSMIYAMFQLLQMLTIFSYVTAQGRSLRMAPLQIAPSEMNIKCTGRSTSFCCPYATLHEVENRMRWYVNEMDRTRSGIAGHSWFENHSLGHHGEIDLPLIIHNARYL